ncbi:hypothetical protein OESDEN_06858 [Oesophagostomum dentatum]|uniref:Uncharacterized protein n=1 Tax=Oesophagostomum dentatum TaxID=61180 RepID=A0A0B1T6Q9_OESDE|nr:hypothetical protein OESDEN_06858 [Oesophagostomum dentatum]
MGCYVLLFHSQVINAQTCFGQLQGLKAHIDRTRGQRDLSRRDDIESWYYMLIEITKGSLPWRLVTDRAQVYAAKLAARQGDGRTQFLGDTPKQYDTLLTWIDALVFEDTPPYSKFYKMLDSLREERKIRMHEHWDWEEETSTITSKSEAEKPK